MLDRARTILDYAPAAAAPKREPFYSMPEVMPFRLTSCPRCDYSLEGLPETGICPECGRSYDQEFIVLPVKLLRSDEIDPAIHGDVSWNRILQLVIYFAVILIDPGIFQVGFFFYLALLIALPNFVGLVVRWSSIRETPTLLWLSKTGMAQSSTVPIGSALAALQHWTIRLSRFGFVIFFFIMWPHRIAFLHGNRIVLLLFILFFCLSAVAVWAPRPQPEGSAKSDDPPLYPWRIFDTVQLEHVRGTTYRLYGKHSSWVSRRTIVNVEIKLQPSDADYLRSLIMDWRIADRAINPRARNQSLAKKLGSLIRWLTVKPSP